MKRADEDAPDGRHPPVFDKAAESLKARADANSLADLDDRILQAEQAVVRRDEAWLAQARTASKQAADVARKGAGWAAGGFALAGLVLLARGALTSRSRSPARHATEPRTGTERAAHKRRQHARRSGPGWATLASALALAAPLLPIGVRSWVDPVAGLASGRGWSRLGGTLIERLSRRRSAPLRSTDSPRSPRPAAWAQRPPVRTAAGIDIRRYAGDWFEIARLKPRAQAACAGAVAMSYRSHGTALAVVKRCINRYGRVLQVHGEAHPVVGSAGARMKVTFAPRWLRALPWVWDEHCILLIDADYQYALVGTPDREALWLLARTPTLQRSALIELVECAEAQGFDIDGLQRTPQSG